MESLDVGSRHRIQTLKETLVKDPHSQPTKGCSVTEKMFDSLQLLLIGTYAARVWRGSGTVNLILQCPVIKIVLSFSLFFFSFPFLNRDLLLLCLLNGEFTYRIGGPYLDFFNMHIQSQHISAHAALLIYMGLVFEPLN